MAKNQLVLAFFENEAAADEAVKSLEKWGKANKEIKNGAVSILVKDEQGKIKTYKLGKRKTKTGALAGALVGVLSGGVTVIGGAIVGGILGSFFHKGLGLSKKDLARIDGELTSGKAAVAILAKPKEVQEITAKLVKLGGQPEAHKVTDDALEEAVAAAKATPEEDIAEESSGAPVAEMTS
jgi:uncharacterized membrane protein